MQARLSHDPMRADEAEICALGAMLLSERACDEVLRICPDDSYFVPAHRMISAAIRILHENGTAIDLVILRDALEKVGTLEKCGGIVYLVQIVETVPSASNATYYAEIVREKADLRMMYANAGKVATACKSGNMVEAVMHGEGVTDGIYTRANVLCVDSVMESAKKGLSVGVAHFLPEITKFFDAHGMIPGKFHGFCAHTGKGKTTALCQQAAFSLEQGEKVGIVSLEMTASDLIIKMLRQMTGFVSEDHAARMDGLDEYQMAFAKIRHWIDSGDLAIMDESGSGATLSQVIGWMTAQIKTNKIGVFLIDYVQYILPEKGKKDDFSHHNYMAGKLREFAIDYNITLIGLFQIEFDGKEINFRGGSQYKRDLSTIIVKTLGKADSQGYQDEYLVISKNRYGRLGRLQVFFNERKQVISAWQ